MHIPDSWVSLHMFSLWFKGYFDFTKFPKEPQTFRTDDATSLLLFRKGQYQVELYLLDNVFGITRHGHPGVEVLQVALDVSTHPYWAELNHIKQLEFHGGNVPKDIPPRSGSILAFQKWHPSLKPTTVAAQWSGRPVGPLHIELIKQLNPNCLIDKYGIVTYPPDLLKLYSQ